MIRHYDYPNVKSVVVCGDIHGEFEKLVYQCCVRYRMRDTLVIVAGDCGFGFKYQAYDIDFYYSRTMDRIIDANNYFAFVRGNHDDPWYFDGEHVAYERFRAVPDYSVLTACGHQILCVGGAVSVDRDQRTAGKDWWEERETMDSILEALRYHRHPLRRWVYGHFHHSWNAEIDGILYTMLGIMEMKELR